MSRVPEGKDKSKMADDCAKKVCAIFNDLVGVPTKQTDIEVAHRTGQPGGSTDRPILVRFFDRKIRDSVLQNRKKLRGKGHVIGEDLTHTNYRLSVKAVEYSATTSVWSTNGKVLARVKNRRILKLNIHDNLDEVFRRAMLSHEMSSKEN